ncbi:MAG: hypothetical protein FJW79_07585 [Actinobacteria bacterium]|nr:hypothetical protein [Actinomycetota bacterium]
MRRRKAATVPAVAAPPPTPLVSGRVTVGRARLVCFPSYRLTAAPDLEVGLARYSALNIYFFGPGQKIALPWGICWRLTSLPRGPSLVAVVANEEGRRLAMAAPGAAAGNYGVNGRDYAYTLNPAEGGLGRARLWHLFDGEQVVARFTRRPFGGVCHSPVPLPVVLLGLLLARFGIPGENELRMPSLNWGPPK